jgi:hypothetical protein
MISRLGLDQVSGNSCSKCSGMAFGAPRILFNSSPTTAVGLASPNTTGSNDRFAPKPDLPQMWLLTHTRHYRGTETACRQEQISSFPARVSSPVCAGYQADCRWVGAGRKGDWPGFPAAAENVGVGVRLPGWCRSPLVMEKQCSCLLEQPMQPVRLDRRYWRSDPAA